MADSPSWYGKAFKIEGPAGILAVLLTSGLVGVGAAGGVSELTREADMAAVDARVDARIDAVVEQLRREQQAATDAAEALAGARYDEILRRLDRIERRLDTTP
jgi:CHASE1-domain containing sensor protein